MDSNKRHMTPYDRYVMLLNAKSGQDDEFHENMPIGGYGTYSMYDLEEADDNKAEQPKKAVQKQKVVNKKEVDSKGSGDTNKMDNPLEMIQKLNSQYLEMISNLIKQSPTQKDFYDLNKKIEDLSTKQTNLSKEVDDLKPPSPQEKSQRIQDSNPQNIPVGDYFRQYYNDQNSQQIRGFDGTLDSISGKSFRDYLNIS